MGPGGSPFDLTPPLKSQAFQRVAGPSEHSAACSPEPPLPLQLRRLEGSIEDGGSRLLGPIQDRLRQSDRHEGKPRGPRQRRGKIARTAQVVAAIARKGRHRRTDPRTVPPIEKRTGIEADRREDVAGNVDLMPSPVDRHHYETASHELGDTGMSGGLRRLGRSFRSKDQRAKLDQRGRCLACIALECRAVRHRIVVEIEYPRLGHVGKGSAGKPAGVDGTAHTSGDRIGHHVAMRLSLDEIAPVLQAYFAWQGFADQVTDACQFGIEGVEGGKRSTLVLRHQQAGEIAIEVGLAERCNAGCVWIAAVRRHVSLPRR
jgi:hypothetical protein